MTELKKWTPAARMYGNTPRGYMVGKKDGHWVFASAAEERIAELEAQLAALEWTPITPENLPNDDSEVIDRNGNVEQAITAGNQMRDAEGWAMRG